MEPFVYQIKYSVWFAYYDSEEYGYRETPWLFYSPLYTSMKGIKEWLRDNSEALFLYVCRFFDDSDSPYHTEAGKIIHQKLMDQIKKKGLKHNIINRRIK